MKNITKYPANWRGFLYFKLKTKLLAVSKKICHIEIVNPSSSSENTLKALFPMVIVLILLMVGVILLPKLSADPRSRASEPKTFVTPTTSPRPTFPPMSNSEKPEIICSELYSPVCDTNTNTTYPNPCEAQKVGVFRTTTGECANQKPITLPSTN